jgi:hypothetical protein
MSNFGFLSIEIRRQRTLGRTGVQSVNLALFSNASIVLVQKNIRTLLALDGPRLLLLVLSCFSSNGQCFEKTIASRVV